jgi:hypothetical protein
VAVEASRETEGIGEMARTSVDGKSEGEMDIQHQTLLIIRDMHLHNAASDHIFV